MALGTSANHQRAILFFFLLKDPTFLPHCRGDCFHLIERQRRPRSGMVWIGLIFGNILKFTHICMFWCTIVHPFHRANPTMHKKIIHYHTFKSRGERERLFGSREREGKLKITFPFYGKGTGIQKLLREGKGREI